MKRRLVLGLVALTGLAALSLRPAGVGVHVSGDGAPSLAGQAVERPEEAALELVLLRRWQNMENLPWLRRLCRTTCDGSHAAVLIRVPSLAGLRKVLVVDLSGLGAGPTLDATGSLPEEVVACLSAVWDEPAQAPCGLEMEQVWRLPYGL